jgi:hypothetical protein
MHTCMIDQEELYWFHFPLLINTVKTCDTGFASVLAMYLTYTLPENIGSDDISYTRRSFSKPSVTVIIDPCILARDNAKPP